MDVKNKPFSSDFDEQVWVSAEIIVIFRNYCIAKLGSDSSIALNTKIYVTNMKRWVHNFCNTQRVADRLPHFSLIRMLHMSSLWRLRFHNIIGYVRYHKTHTQTAQSTPHPYYINMQIVPDILLTKQWWISRSGVKTPFRSHVLS